jgi:hypothetical protein
MKTKKSRQKQIFLPDLNDGVRVRERHCRLACVVKAANDVDVERLAAVERFCEQWCRFVDSFANNHRSVVVTQKKFRFSGGLGKYITGIDDDQSQVPIQPRAR